MKTFRPTEEDFIETKVDNVKFRLLKREVFENFNPSLLDLGDIKKESQSIPAIAAVFDLTGFTNFCKQIDPHLSVPLYLSSFLDWIFGAIRAETTEKETKHGVTLWHALPFYTKFLGDGLLILWDVTRMKPIAQHNLILSLVAICERYQDDFFPPMKRKVCDPPPVLRCGMTKGTVYSVGDGNDFVGPCINLATRLQKLPGITFVFARRGFDPESRWDEQGLANWVLKKVAIRGLAHEELIYLRKQEVDGLSIDDRSYLHDP
jgi:hypothetical protein